MVLNNKFWNEFFHYFSNECKQLYRNKGFSYDIPKEEQIRSSLYAFLKEKGVLIELESDLFERKTNRVLAEYDLRLIGTKKDTLIEIKRAYALNIWMNDFTNFLKSWQSDIDKLESIDNKDNVKKCFLLLVFTNKGERSQKLLDKLLKRITSFKEYIKKKWVNYDFYETDFISLGEYISANSKHEARTKLLVWWK